MSTLLYEHMLRVEAGGRVCRIWREIDITVILTTTNEQLKEKAMAMMYQNAENAFIVATLAGHEFVNSVEVIDKVTGDGVCVHKDWP